MHATKIATLKMIHDKWQVIIFFLDFIWINNKSKQQNSCSLWHLTFHLRLLSYPTFDLSLHSTLVDHFKCLYLSVIVQYRNINKRNDNNNNVDDNSSNNKNQLRGKSSRKTWCYFFFRCWTECCIMCALLLISAGKEKLDISAFSGSRILNGWTKYRNTHILTLAITANIRIEPSY